MLVSCNNKIETDPSKKNGYIYREVKKGCQQTKTNTKELRANESITVWALIIRLPEDAH